MITKNKLLRQDAELELYNGKRIIIFSDERIIIQNGDTEQEIKYEDLLPLLFCLAKVKVFGEKNTIISFVLNGVNSNKDNVEVIYFDQNSNLKQIASSQHTLIIDSNGSVYSRGRDDFGQSGQEKKEERKSLFVSNRTLVKTKGILNGKNVASVTVGNLCSFALDINGDVYAWGHNGSRELCDETTEHKYLPIKILKTMVAISSKYEHSLALSLEGEVYAWGNSNDGRIGSSSSGEDYNKIQGLLLNKNIVSVSAGRAHSLALDSDGQVYTWGLNGCGQLGDGKKYKSKNYPIEVRGLLENKNIVSISAGDYYSVALDSDGNIYAWGYIYCGDFSENAIINPFPTQIINLKKPTSDKIISISAGDNHFLALDLSGKVYAWGRNNHGQLGDGTRFDNFALNSVDEILKERKITSVYAGSKSSFAVDSEGKTYVWGNNFFNQIQDGSIRDILSPTEITIPNEPL